MTRRAAQRLSVFIDDDKLSIGLSRKADWTNVKVGARLLGGHGCRSHARRLRSWSGGCRRW